MLDKVIFLALFDDIINSFIFLAEGNETVPGIIQNPMMMGAMILLFLSFFAFLLMLPFEAFLVVEIPTLFATFTFIPMLRPVIGILFGFAIGIGLLKWVRR